MPVRRIKLFKPDESPTRITAENLEIWTSSNNYRYQRKEVRFDEVEAVEPSRREVVDYYGDVVTAKGAPVRTLILEGLDDMYILVTTGIGDGEPDFINTAVGMIEANGPEPRSPTNRRGDAQRHGPQRPRLSRGRARL